LELIGRNLSPFVRRTAVVLKLVNQPFDQRALSTTDDADELSKINPVTRVPSLIMDDGECLIDSNAIIDHLLEVGDPDNSLLPSRGVDRRNILRLAAIGHGVMEKGVASAYERGRRPKELVYDQWVEMVEGQVAGGLAALNDAAATGDWLYGDHMTLADVNAVVAFDFVGIAEPYLLKDDAYPALAALAARCGELPAFADTAFKPD
jgi:glutathione S-transferase